MMYNENHSYSTFATRKSKVIYPRSNKNKEEKEPNSYIFIHPLMPGFELFHVKVILMQLKQKYSRMEHRLEKTVQLLKLI